MKIPVCRYTDIVYRAHHPMWAYTPLSGAGAFKYGGRFNLNKSVEFNPAENIQHKFDKPIGGMS